MNTVASKEITLNADDFNAVFTPRLDEVNGSKTYIYSRHGQKRLWFGTVRATAVFQGKSTISPH